MDPMGLAVHYRSGRLYWLDKASTSHPSHGVGIYSVSLTSLDDARMDVAINTVDDEQVSTNTSQALIILFGYNNTAVFADWVIFIFCNCSLSLCGFREVRIRDSLPQISISRQTTLVSI